jgi:hypothetical protein
LIEHLFRRYNYSFDELDHMDLEEYDFKRRLIFMEEENQRKRDQILEYILKKRII